VLPPDVTDDVACVVLVARRSITGAPSLCCGSPQSVKEFGYTVGKQIAC